MCYKICYLHSLAPFLAGDIDFRKNCWMTITEINLINGIVDKVDVMEDLRSSPFPVTRRKHPLNLNKLKEWNSL